MKTKKSLLITMLMVALLFSYTSFAQDEEKESYGMAEIAYMYPKVGMETAFVNAVKEHNATFHEALYAASMDYIMTGEESGWYVWFMGPCTFTDMDNAPGEGAHSDDWTKNVAPNVEKYGRQEFWKINSKLSYGEYDPSLKFSNLWIIDIKRGDYYRFKAIMLKIKEAYEKKGEGNMRVFNAQFNDDVGRDVVISWDLKNLAELDDDSGSIKADYEEINGENSWNNMLDEWEEITISVKSQLWRNNVTK